MPHQSTLPCMINHESVWQGSGMHALIRVEDFVHVQMKAAALSNCKTAKLQRLCSAFVRAYCKADILELCTYGLRELSWGWH